MQWEKEKSVAFRFKRPDLEVPILVPSGEGRRDAVASFYVVGLGQMGIRVLRRGDFNEVAYRSLSKRARGELRELIALRQGIVEQEDPSFWLREFLRVKAREGKFKRKVAAAVTDDVPSQSQRVGMTIVQDKFGRKILAAVTEDMKQIWPSQRTRMMIGQVRLFGDPLTRLSVAITKKLARARLVLWWTGPPRMDRVPFNDELEMRERVAYLMHWRKANYVPAIFCPDMETAFYVYALFQITGRGFGICLHCGEVFQRTRSDLLYCCQSHASAYRLRRWRDAHRKKIRGGKS